MCLWLWHVSRLLVQPQLLFCFSRKKITKLIIENFTQISVLRSLFCVQISCTTQPNVMTLLTWKPNYMKQMSETHTPNLRDLLDWDCEKCEKLFENLFLFYFNMPFRPSGFRNILVWESKAESPYKEHTSKESKTKWNEIFLPAEVIL